MFKFIIIAAIVAAVLLLIFGSGSLERKLLFYPSHRTGPNGLTPWTKDARLMGYSRTVESPNNIWLLIHGNGGQATDRVYSIRNFSEADSVFILEYPGFGNRPGKPSRESFDEAAKEAYLELRSLFPKTPICVAGESIGSGPACFLASLPLPPEKVALVVPFDTLSSVAKHHFPSILVNLILRADWDNAASLSGYDGPVDIFGAESDTVIPVSHAKALAASVPQSKFTLIAGGHNDWSDGDRVRFRYP